MAFVILAFASGIGVVLYAAFWAVLPLSTEDPDVDPSAARSADTTRLLALAAVAIGVALLMTAAGVNIVGGAIVPIILAVVGAALIWRQADEEQRDSWSAAASRAARTTAGTTAGAGRWRIAIGIGLVVLGLVALLASRTGPAEALQALATALLLIGGVAVVVFPWVYRRFREQGEQRRALIRSEERAEIAAHVHDSVLQTLTLIQRNADDPAEVARLARTEERALRSWLYTPTGDPDRTFAAAIQRDAADVETTYGATIDVVVVGDASIDARVAALLAAAREAMVNAARHGGGQVSVYAEAADDSCGGVRARPRPGLRPDIRPGRPARTAGVRRRPHGAQRGNGDRAQHARGGDRGRAAHPTTGGGDPMSEKRLRVVLVDDHAMVRAGVRTELGDTVDVVGEAADVDEAVRVILETAPDVVLLDVHLPGGDGRAVLDACLPQLPATRFLALSVSDAPEDVVSVVRGGARGYVTKAISGAELRESVQRIADGDAVFSPRLAGFVLDAFAGGAAEQDDEIDRLTPREREVMRLIARGYTYREVASELVLSIKTVETHVSAVLRKLQLSDRRELAKWASARRLI